MAWNGSSNINITNQPKQKTRVRQFALTRLAVLGVGALMLGFVAWRYMSESASAPIEVENDSIANRIADASADLIKESTREKVDYTQTKARTPSKRVDLPPQRPGEVRDGWLKFADGRKMKVAGVITSRVEAVTLADKTFNKFSDRCIATLLTTEFGDGFLGDSEELFSEFNEQFEDSLSEEIVIEPEDSEDVRVLKAAIIDVRNDLIKRKNAGEDLAKIMIETRDQLIELATYREELEQQVEKLTADNELSEEDEEELIKAANTMLEDRGIKPFELPSVAKQYMIINVNDSRE